jgi:hypothetical protein
LRTFPIGRDRQCSSTFKDTWASRTLYTSPPCQDKNKVKRSINTVALFRVRNLIFICLGMLAFLWVPFEAIDSHRYYLNATPIDTDIALIDIIIRQFFSSFDFIYYLLFGLCIALDIPVQAVTGISVCLLYYQSFVFIDNVNSKYGLVIRDKDDYLLKLSVIFLVSFVTVFGISRNVTALMFFSFGINSLLIERYKKAIIFFALSIFTHIGLIIYLTIFVVGYYWKGTFIKNILLRRIILITVTIFGLNSHLWLPHALPSLSSLTFFVTFSYYTQYLAMEEAANVFGFLLGKWDILLFVTSATSLFYALYFIKKYNSIVWVCYITYNWLAISMGYSQMFTQRTVLFLIIMQGALASIFFSQQHNSLVASIYRGILIISILAFFLNVYAYRGFWVFEFPQY